MAALCDRCARISWEKPLDPEDDARRIICTLHETAEDLLLSSCRICQIFGRAISVPACDIADVDVSINHYGTVDFRCNNATLYDRKGEADWPQLYYVERELATADTYTLHMADEMRSVDVNLVEHWLRDCKDTHEDCSPVQQSFPHGIKVIDCSQRQVVQAPEGCAYVALSYVWGKADSQVNSHCRDMAMDFPQTIEDSIQVTRHLGYQYLWVDRYCIDQSNTAEKEQQIRQMGAIYSCAQLTVIAAAGTDPLFGLPGISRGRRIFDTTEPAGQGRLIFRSDSIDNHISRSLWASRAWTFQEGFLSKRRLFFTDQETAYVCNQGAHQETGHNAGEDSGWLREGPLRRCFPQDDAGFYAARDLLQEYTRRDLTSDHDSLNAILGALNTLQDQSEPTHHIWGVPFCAQPRQDLSYPPNKSHEVIIDLLWFHLQMYESVPCRRLADFPSWSPLGWKGRALFPDYAQSVPNQLKIEFWQGGTYHHLHTRALEGINLRGLSSTHESKTLRISAHAVPFALEYTAYEWKFTRLAEKDWHLRVRVDENSNFFFKPAWDSPFDQVNEPKAGMCMVLDDLGSSTLVLFEHDGFYERRGFFDYMMIQYGDAFIRSDSGDSLVWGLDLQKQIPLLRIAKEQTFFLR